MGKYSDVIDLILFAPHLVWYFLLGIFAHIIAPVCLLLFIIFKFITLRPSRKWIERFLLVYSLSFFSIMTRFHVAYSFPRLYLNCPGSENDFFQASGLWLLSFSLFIFSVIFNLKWMRDEFRKNAFKNKLSISLALFSLIITLPVGTFLLCNLTKISVMGRNFIRKVDILHESFGSSVWVVIFLATLGILAVMTICLVSIFSLIRIPRKSRRCNFFKLINKSYIESFSNEKYKRDPYFYRKTFIVAITSVSLYILVSLISSYNFEKTYGILNENRIKENTKFRCNPQLN